MTSIFTRLAGIEAIAEAVPWPAKWYSPTVLTKHRAMEETDAALVAACDPPTILALTAALRAEKARADAAEAAERKRVIDWLRAQAEHPFGAPPWTRVCRALAEKLEGTDPYYLPPVMNGEKP